MTEHRIGTREDWQAARDELERSLEEVKRRTKVIGRFPGETSCLSLCWAVLDLFIASARGLGLTTLEHRQLAQMHAARMAQASQTLTA
jgi:transposase-like protein